VLCVGVYNNANVGYLYEYVGGGLDGEGDGYARQAAHLSVKRVFCAAARRPHKCPARYGRGVEWWSEMFNTQTVVVLGKNSLHAR